MPDVNGLIDIIVSICNDILIKDKARVLSDLEGNDWDMMLHLASIQGVLPILTIGFEDFKPKDHVLRMKLVQWYGLSSQNRNAYHHRVEIMRQMSKWFMEENIDIMFIKGASLAQLYPEPDRRVFSDIDFYLYGESSKGVAIMAKHGIDNTPYYHHHTQASFQGVLLENHYDFIERVNHKCDIVLDNALKGLAQKEGRSIRAVFLGGDITNAYLMTPTMNAIFLMRHMSAHFTGETIPLRMLYDWALFIKEQGKDVDWGFVIQLYEESGMMKFAGIVKSLLHQYLDFECSFFPVSYGRPEDVERVWQSIILPSPRDPYPKYSLKYYFYETKIFFDNRWKHSIVYPGESYFILFLKYMKHGIHRMFNRTSN